MNKDNIHFDFVKLNFYPEFVYFLGFCWADGTIDDHGYHNKVSVEIASDDADQLKPIFDKVGIWTIYKRKRKRVMRGKSLNARESTRFRISNKQFVNFLVSYGYKDKISSHQHILNIIPKDLHVYFFRGLIDGDGCFCKYLVSKKYDRLSLNISSHIDQDWSGVEKFLSDNEIRFRLSLQKTEGYRHSSIIVDRNVDILKMVDLLYKNDDSIYLKRKYEKAKSFSILP